MATIRLVNRQVVSRLLSAAALSIFAVAIIGGSNGGADAHPSRASSHVRLVGYYGDWDRYCSKCLGLQQVPFEHLSALIYAFAGVSGDVCRLGAGDAGNDFPIIRRARQRYPRLKVLLSLGGGGSTAFPAAVSTTAKIDRLVKSCVQLIQGPGKGVFDGIDVDWEGPQGAKQREEYTRLLRRFRHRLPKSDALTSAVTVYFDIDWKAVSPLLTWVNLMTYDFHGPWGDPVTDFLAPIRASPRNPEYKKGFSVTGNVHRMIHEDHVPRQKIVMGIPFYARGYAGVRSKNHGLYQKYAGETKFGTIAAGSFEYRDLVANYIDKRGYRRYGPDAHSGEYWLYKRGEKGKGVFISFDGLSTVRAKARLVRSDHLGGAMIWDLADDTSSPKTSLLDALSQALK